VIERDVIEQETGVLQAHHAIDCPTILDHSVTNPVVVWGIKELQAAPGSAEFRRACEADGLVRRSFRHEPAFDDQPHVRIEEYRRPRPDRQGGIRRDGQVGGDSVRPFIGCPEQVSACQWACGERRSALVVTEIPQRVAGRCGANAGRCRPEAVVVALRIDKQRIGTEIALARPGLSRQTAIADVNIGRLIRRLDVHRDRCIDDRIGHVVDDGPRRDTRLVVRLKSHIHVTWYFRRHDGSVIDIDDGIGTVVRLGGDAGHGWILRGGVVCHDQTAIDLRPAAVDAHALVPAVTNDGILDANLGPERIDAVVVHPGNDAATDHTLLAGELIVDVDPVGIVGGVHIRDPAVLEPQCGARDLRSHHRPGQQALPERQVRTGAGIHDLARVVGQTDVIEEQCRVGHPNGRARMGVPYRRRVTRPRDVSVAKCRKSRVDEVQFAPVLTGPEARERHRGGCRAKRLDRTLHVDISPAAAGGNALDQDERAGIERQRDTRGNCEVATGHVTYSAPGLGFAQDTRHDLHGLIADVGQRGTLLDPIHTHGQCEIALARESDQDAAQAVAQRAVAGTGANHRIAGDRKRRGRVPCISIDRAICRKQFDANQNGNAGKIAVSNDQIDAR